MQLGSDHTPITITIYQQKEIDDIIRPRWNMRKADWKTFSSLARNVDTSEIANNDLNIFNKNLITEIIQLAEKTVPRTKMRRGRNQRPLPYWNENLDNLIKERNKARNRLNKKQTLDAQVEYSRLKAQTQQAIRKSAKQHWEHYCSSLNENTKLADVWKMSKKMNGNNTFNARNHTIIENGTTLVSPTEKAEAFAKYFAKMNSNENQTPEFITHQQLNHIEVKREIENANKRPANEFLEVDFNLPELKKAINQSKNGKSAGEDEIVYEFIKHLPNKLHKSMLLLYNRIWKTGIVPSSWLHSIVIPIPKPGQDPQQITI